MQKAAITTHILDLHSGRPAAGVSVLLRNTSGATIAKAHSDVDGRVNHWDSQFDLHPGMWTLEFYLQSWFDSRGQSCFFPVVNLCFNVKESEAHYHVPLLLNAHGYSTYRGS